MTDYLNVEIGKRSLSEMAPRMKVLAKSRKMRRYIKKLEEWQAKAREFGDKYVRPKALEIDARCAKDRTYFDWDLVKQSTPYGFLSMLVPRAMGGGGLMSTGCSIVLEELCAACAGIANIYGANCLGISGIEMGFDTYHFDRSLTELAKSERAGQPMIFAAAITEPTAGSDVEDVGYLRTARLVCEAKKVEGGYRLNGQKVFISNGSVAEYVAVAFPLDKSNPVETTCVFLVKRGTKGYSVGRVEEKMGMKACPAAELVFEDCLVPADCLVGKEGEGAAGVEMILGSSRGPVGAIATGTARGAFERIYDYAVQKKVGGRRLIDQQWVQIELADMARKIHLARQAYLDACMTFDFHGMPKLLSLFSSKMLLSGIPAWLRKTKWMTNAMRSGWGAKKLEKLFEKHIDPDDQRHIQSYASLSKVSASDVAVEVAYRALQIAGLEASLHRRELEKIYRDAKLTQIYEGTNQLNRHNIFINYFPGVSDHGS